VVIKGVKLTSISSEDFRGYLTNSVLEDPVGFSTKGLYHADDTLIERYTCNIHIADKDGANLAGRTVDCEDQFGNPVWAAGTITTDAAGDIAEQAINYKQWAGTAETLTTYSPHIFTISKAGYETMVLDNITVDALIAWHLELLPALAEADVRLGTGYGEDETGTLDLPAIGDVEKGIQFDNTTKEGNFEAPAEEDVEVGVGYGSLGAEFEGTYLGLKGENLTAELEESVALVGYLQKEEIFTGELKL